MSLSKEDVLNAIAEMSVMEVVELISDMEEKFGVSAAAAVAVAAPAAGGGEAAGGGAEEKTEFDVYAMAKLEDARIENHNQTHLDEVLSLMRLYLQSVKMQNILPITQLNT